MLHLTTHTGDCYWSDNDLAIADILDDVVIQPGSPMRAQTCVSCGQPAGAEPVQLVMVAQGVVCPNHGDHLAGLALVIHAKCPTPDDDVLLDRIIEILGQHSG